MDHARERARHILAEHEPRELDPAVDAALEQFRQVVATRDVAEFYEYEQPEKQDYSRL
jgi:hypothetical protein